MVALFVILFVVIALLVDVIIQARQKKYPLITSTLTGTVQTHHGREILRMPKGIFFHPGHTWARILTGDKLEVGIDDFIQKTIGAIEKVDLPMIGTFVKQGEPIITLQRGAHSIRVVAPVSGHIAKVNADAANNPALINENPYKEGWLCVVEPEQLASNLSFLSIAEDAVNWIKSEVVRFREFITGEIQQPQLVGVTMFDGGVPVTGSLEHLEDESWQKFEKSFLR